MLDKIIIVSAFLFLAGGIIFASVTFQRKADAIEQQNDLLKQQNAILRQIAKLPPQSGEPFNDPICGKVAPGVQH